VNYFGTITNLAAPQGFEPRYADPESAVLPLNEGAAIGLEKKRSDSLILWALRAMVNHLAPQPRIIPRTGIAGSQFCWSATA
jgi:hypothetical protein